jgi:hypothetical protein
VGNRMGPLRPGLLAAAAAAFLATGGLSACGEDEPDRQVYCVDEQGNVVDPDLCDERHYGSGVAFWPYWYYVSTSHFPVGGRVPSDWRTSRISPTDANARANAGVPRSGKIGGTTVKGGGFGSGTGGGRAGSSGGS